MSDQTELEINDESKMDSVETYKFEPIKGYPMLNWKGKRPFTSTQYYPAQLKENHGEPVDGWMNRIYWGDNLQVMSHLLKEFRGKVDLIYIDPPFDSKADYKKKIILRGDQSSKTNDYSAIEEKQYSDIWNSDGFLQFFFERMILIKELLRDTGSLVVHCDFHKSHLVRSILDEIFGVGASTDDKAPGFRNEIIYCYSGGGVPKKALPRKHDNLFWYTKSAQWTYNPIYREYSEGTQQRGRTAVKGEGAELREEGTPINDWWDDVKRITSPTDLEKLYYPTQKSEDLVGRVVDLFSNPGDLVFDCFMGSGTTQAVSLKKGRRFLGADINVGAIQTTTKRLINIIKNTHLNLVKNMPGFTVFNVNNYDVFRNPVEAKDILIEALEIQPLPSNSVYDGEKDGRMVKIMPINRITTKADLNPLITGFDYSAFQKKQESAPNKPVEMLLLVCMGHEPDLAAHLKRECHGFVIDVKVVDILRDKANLEFKRDSEAEIVVDKGKLKIAAFYPMNLLQKLSLQKEKVGDWRELTESVMIDWNYDGGVFEPTDVDVPEKNEMVTGEYTVPKDAGTIRIKITDLLSESLEMEVPHGKS